MNPELEASKDMAAPDGAMAPQPTSGTAVTSGLEIGRGRELLTLKGHTGWVNSVAFSPDGRSPHTSTGKPALRTSSSGTSRSSATGFVLGARNRSKLKRIAMREWFPCAI